MYQIHLLDSIIPNILMNGKLFYILNMLKHFYQIIPPQNFLVYLKIIPNYYIFFINIGKQHKKFIQTLENYFIFPYFD